MFYRFAIGVPLGTLFVGLFAFGKVSLLIAAIIASWFATREFWRTTGVSHPGTLLPLSRLGDVAVAAMLIVSFLWWHSSLAVFIAVMIPTFAAYQVIAVSRGAKNFLKELSIVTLGVLYVGGLVSIMFQLRHLQIYLQNREIDPLVFNTLLYHREEVFYLTMFPVLVGWGTDSAALFAGKYFGKEQLAAKVSPKKTIAGLVGGMVGCAASVTLFGYLIGLVGQIQIWEFILFGIVSAGISQLGDLVMSAIKREARIKDMGRLLGAHGGMLDRIDSLMFAIPACYLFFYIVLW